MKQYIIAVLALLGFAGNANADTAKLTAADGWTKITTVPTSSDIANNYYVFVDNSNDLMLGVAKGVHQDTKWYSLGVYYQTSVEPTSADMNGKTWTLESYDGGFAMRNLEYSVFCLQTEWNAAWKWDTNDVQIPNEWVKINLNYLPEGCWTIQNGKYPDSGYLGPWDNSIVNGAECAANKTGGNVGKFQLYAISRTQFKQNLLDNASNSNPVDLTPWYVTNATFDAGNRTGWTEEGSGGNNNTSIGGGCEIWHRSNFKIYQNLTLPNGKYKVSLQIAGGSAGDGQVYGTSGSTTKTVSSTATAGSNFQNTILSMIRDRTFGKVLTDEIEVSNGSLQMGMKCETSDQWLVFDNFKLYCTGVDLSAYESQLADLVSECNTFISSNVVPDACENAISSAISTYNQSYSTAKEYSNAIVALTNVLNTYRNDTELKAAYADFKSFKSKVVGLTTGQPSSTALTAFNTAVGNATTAVEAATTAAAITAQNPNLRSAGLTYISSVEGQFDITFLASQAISDWKKKDGSAAGEVTWAVTNRGDLSFAESYEGTCATTGTVLYQTVSSLPAGYYQVGMYAMAAYTSGRGFSSDATEGDANRSYAFAGDLTDASSIQRTGIAIPFKTEFDLSELTTLDVNIHLTSEGTANNLTFGVQKDANGSNWHFAQIMSIIYSKSPDLTALKATRDALVSEAEGLLSGSSDYLTSAQQDALQDAIDKGNAADDFDALNTVTLTTLPNAINTAKQQIAQVKAAIPTMIAALERFENNYNLVDGTDYSRVTMSAGAWTDLLAKVNAVSTALDDISQATTYATKAQELVAQMDATDASLRLFKSYKAMVEGTPAILDGALSSLSSVINSSNMDTDAAEQTVINTFNDAVDELSLKQCEDFSMNAFLGDNLDFSAAEGDALNTENSNNIRTVNEWEVSYADADTWAVVQSHQNENDSKLYMRKNWGSSPTTLLAQKQRMLPVGKYSLSLSWNSDMQNMTNHSCFKVGNTTTTIGEATEGAKTLTYNFEVTEEAKPFDLVIGFTKTGTGNSPAQIVVDDISLTMNRVVNNVCDKFTIVDTDPVSITKTFTATLLENSRTLTQSDAAYTICLPYALSSNDDVQFYELTSAASGILHFTEVATTEPLKPYLAIAMQNASLNASNVEVVTTTSGSSNVSVDGYTMKGTMTTISRAEAETLGAYILQSDNKWKKVDNSSSASAYIPAFRAYIVADDPSSVRLLSSSFGDETTSIDAVRKDTLEAELYDLNGRLVGRMPLGKGFYVRSGKKVIVK